MEKDLFFYLFIFNRHIISSGEILHIYIYRLQQLKNYNNLKTASRVNDLDKPEFRRAVQK